MLFSDHTFCKDVRKDGAATTKTIPNNPGKEERGNKKRPLTGDSTSEQKPSKKLKNQPKQQATYLGNIKRQKQLKNYMVTSYYNRRWVRNLSTMLLFEQGAGKWRRTSSLYLWSGERRRGRQVTRKTLGAQTNNGGNTYQEWRVKLKHAQKKG